ncbi:UNKNOWN [Stylonychia lemnae]|uniref:Uncharacterized protein n=1 Tax=Stylonychia lemnae TaxID=5949 RepID=A0A078AGJ9_STYLE|nr:UNKNOWN [Stylonychia lemnae]|eukprot:CDW81354.1 UNKNOWN [Stylonychia lemnae]
MSKLKNVAQAASVGLHQNDSLKEISRLLPWNLKSYLMKKDVQDLEAPVNLEKYLPLQFYNSLYKDYAEALYENDFQTLRRLLEPKFAQQVGNNLETLFKDHLNDQDSSRNEQHKYNLRIQNNRKNKDHTDVFLYHIENYMLIGCDIDRREITKDKKFQIIEDEKITLDVPQNIQGQMMLIKQEIPVKQVIEVDKVSKNTKSILMMRMHLLVSSYLNLYVEDPNSLNQVIGNKITQFSEENMKSHTMIVDKKVAELYLGDALLDQQTQIDERLIKSFGKQEEAYISDFDGFMKGNHFLSF